MDRTKHIYLTNAGCEPTDHITPEQLKELRLEFGWWTGKEVVSATKHGKPLEPSWEFYPLAPEEYKLISDSGFYTGEKYFGFTGYTTLFYGMKWLCANIEIEWFTDAKASYGYEPQDMHAVDMLGAYLLAVRLAARATTRLEQINGYADIEETMETADDRFTVSIHIPMEWAVKNLKSAEEYCAFLNGLTL